MNKPVKQMGKHRKMWLDAHLFKAILYKGYGISEQGVSIEFANKEVGEPARLTFEAGRKVLHLNLTSMTEEGLDLFQQFLNEVIEEVRPTIQNLDAQAEQALEEGTDVYFRSYQQPAFITYRRDFEPIAHRKVHPSSDGEREQPQHDQSLQDGSDEAVGVQGNSRIHPEDR